MILSCQNIQKAFVGNEVLKEISFHIEDHEKAAIVGINGAGKSTLLKIIVGEMAADDGQVILGKGKSLGYLSQNAGLSDDNTIYEELLSVKQDLIALEHKIRETEKSMKDADEESLAGIMEEYSQLTHRFEASGGYVYKSELIGVLKGLGFTEEEFDKKTSALSGGQKTRVALGRLLLLSPDLIILDEPTNHLDIMSKEILEDALNHYEGTVLYVSHDRYFINKTAHRILELSGGDFTNYLGNYDYYLLKKEQLAVNTPAASAAAPTEDTESKTDWKQQKEEQAQKRKKENDLKKCEQRIEKLEEEKASLEEKMCDPSIATDVGKLQELSKKIEETDGQLSEAYEEWERLAE